MSILPSDLLAAGVGVQWRGVGSCGPLPHTAGRALVSAALDFHPEQSRAPGELAHDTYTLTNRLRPTEFFVVKL